MAKYLTFWTLAANYDPNATSITVPSVPLSSTITGATLGGSGNYRRLIRLANKWKRGQ